MKNKVATVLPGILLFLASLILGICVYQDYGVSWDEPAQRLIGRMNYNYVFHGNDSLFSFADKDYGAAFELPLMVMEKTFRLSDDSRVYPARHIATHIFFLFSVFCGYLLVLRLFGRQWLACLAFIMLAFAPRFYAHSFFNTKDIPFLSALLISFTIFELASRRRQLFLFLLLGISAGYFTGIRIMGIVPAAFMSFFLLADVVICIFRKQQAMVPTKRLLLFLLGFLICLYAVFPFLWQHPIDGISFCLQKMAHKEYAGKNLLMGQYIPTNALPWYYLPFWISVTIPPLWVFAGVGGIIFTAISFLKKPIYYLQSHHGRNLLLYAMCFSAPVTAVMLFHSVIYDEWRHLYFVYPSLVLLGIGCINRLSQARTLSVVMAACAIQVLFVCGFMVSAHPFQQVYFNEAVPREREYLRKNFEFDYWGASVKQALEHLLYTNPGKILKIVDPGFELYIKNNVAALPPADRARIQLGTEENSDFLITTYRYHPQDFEYPVYYSIPVLNSSIVCIYKLR
jgi:hypothetical protein